MSRSPSDTQSKEDVNAYLAGWLAMTRLLRQGRSWSGHERNCVFLNCGSGGTPEFADVSAATGLDFADDGRGLATTDWDQDGDLDLWLVNRTGPRLRFMRNDLASPAGSKTANFVAIKLQGTRCNRDAIGARVEVHLEADASNKLVQTLHAGDGFISQSSKWLHFGLGKQKRIRRVVVHWPDVTPGVSGIPRVSPETFTGAMAGGRFLLRQGDGAARQWIPPQRTVNLTASTQITPATTQAAQIRLSSPFPMPSLRYTRFDDPTPHVINGPGSGTRGSALLVNFWASWCVPCVGELKSLAEHERKLRDAGLNILALSVDGFDEKQNTGPSEAQDLLKRVNFPFDAGMATIEILDKLDIVQEILFKRHPPFVVPVSFLFDREGRLVALYRGPLNVEDLLQDVAELDATPDRMRDRSVPFSGRWYPIGLYVRLSTASGKFKDRYPQESARYLQWSLEQMAPRSAGSDSEESWATKQVGIHFQLGDLLWSMDRQDEAAKQYEHALRIKPDSAEAHHNLGLFYRHRGKFDKAIEHFGEAVKIKPDYGSAHMNLGRVLAGLKRFTEATTHLRKATELLPDVSGVHHDLGSALCKQGNFAEGIDEYRRALQLDDKKIQTYNNLAMALVFQGQIQEGQEQLQRAIQVDPDEPTAYFNLAILHRNQGQNEKTIDYYRQYLKRRPDNPLAHNNLANVLVQQDEIDQAIAHYRKAIEAKSDFATAHYNLANTLRREGQTEEALHHYRRAVEVKPDYVHARLSLAHMLYTRRDWDSAIEHLQQLLQIKPDLADAHQLLGRVLLAQRKNELATEHFRQALAHNDQMAEAHLGLGMALSVTGPSDEALGALRQAIRLNPNWAAPINVLAQILAASPDAALRRPEEAVELAERAVELTRRENPKILDTLAIALAAAEQFDRAVSVAEEALELASANLAEEQVESIREHLELFKQNKPYRMSVPYQVSGEGAATEE